MSPPLSKAPPSRSSSPHRLSPRAGSPPSAAPAVDVEGTVQRSTAHLETEDPHDTWALLYGLAAMASFVAACLGYRVRALSLPCSLLVLLASGVALGLCRRHLDSQRRTRTPCEKVDATTSLSRSPPPARSIIAPPVESCLFTWARSRSGSIR